MKKLLLLFLLIASFLSAPFSKAYSEEVKELIAVLTPAESSKVKGVVTFTEQTGNKVKVIAHIEGLEPNTKHGFHIHEFGNINSPDGMAAGGHYNPEKHEHGLPQIKNRHAGDFGNIEADANGIAHFEIIVDNIKLAGGDHAIIGRGLIVHEKPDDGSQPTGNAGARLAQGVIGVKAPTQLSH